MSSGVIHAPAPRPTDGDGRLDPGAHTSVLVGRASACEVVLADRTVSRLHARFERDGSEWIVRDLGSRNGTAVNGVGVDRMARVRAGDFVSFGARGLLFTPSVGG
jgi:pSer/pThr/pTyr-binding forkhead associated (FHA) protein